ncbi:MAG: hypothetical protein IPK35_11140 [Saprospiraceae bacterium]|nr:hypothetical protein [Saprospiraceae bacterium]
MSSVFFILLIVVSGGGFLIKMVNKIQLDIHEVPFTSLKTETTSSNNETAIVEAIKKLTEGKAKIEYIKKK